MNSNINRTYQKMTDCSKLRILFPLYRLSFWNNEIFWSLKRCIFWSNGRISLIFVSEEKWSCKFLEIKKCEKGGIHQFNFARQQKFENRRIWRFFQYEAIFDITLAPPFAPPFQNLSKYKKYLITFILHQKWSWLSYWIDLYLDLNLNW